MAQKSHGTLLKIGNGGSPETVTTIAEMLDMEGPEIKNELEETTGHDDASKKYVAKLKDNGGIDYLMNYVDAATQNESTGIVADANSGVTRNFELHPPNPYGKKIKFAGIVESHSFMTPINGVFRAKGRVKITGDITFAAKP